MKKFAVVGALIILVLLAILGSRAFMIRDFECYTQLGVCEEEIDKKLSEKLPLRYSDALRHSEEVFRNNTQIFEYSSRLKLPSTLRLDIIVREPIFSLRSESVDSVSLIDQFGKVVKIEKSTNLPSMYIEGRLPNVGEEVDEDLLKQIMIARNLHNSLNIERISSEGSDMYVVAKDTPLLILPTPLDSELMLGSVNLILSRLKHVLQESKIDISEVSRIDFRYKDPIIVKN